MSDGTFSKMIAGIEALLKAQIHAMVLVFVGAGLAIAGHKDEALLVLGGAMGMLQKHEQ